MANVTGAGLGSAAANIHTHLENKTIKQQAPVNENGSSAQATDEKSTDSRWKDNDQYTQSQQSTESGPYNKPNAQDSAKETTSKSETKSASKAEKAGNRISVEIPSKSNNLTEAQKKKNKKKNPADKNGDGKVTINEQLEYNMKKLKGKSLKQATSTDKTSASKTSTSASTPTTSTIPTK
ncbi:hypothetical protein KS4_36300 [Poriferisphaera corsica]|uniref:Uncharacterized protein n=1 Tax=Poriferisphaera corsica TaxID=2528020 RepID=A0A517YZ96_9BACT|nr:hypothetical protein [Poriferisphaera corsica]QDU35547.1 hypothetical protein KS4_36300 [Poriferisphaera corsica]